MVYSLKDAAFEWPERRRDIYWIVACLSICLRGSLLADPAYQPPHRSSNGVNMINAVVTPTQRRRYRAREPGVVLD